MLDVAKLDKLLEQRIVQIGAAIGVVLLVETIVESVLFHLAAAIGSSLVFDGFWNLTYIGVLATFVAVGLWVGLSVMQSYEQPWWMIVAGAAAGWSLIIVPILVELPAFLANVLLLAGQVVQLLGVVMALTVLDRIAPRHVPPAPSYGGPSGQAAPSSFPGQGSEGYEPGGFAAGQGYGAESATQAYSGGQDLPSESATQAYSGGQDSGSTGGSPGGVPAGWYPDPHGQASSRWWDGSAWTNEVR